MTTTDAMEALDKLENNYGLKGGWNPSPTPLIKTIRQALKFLEEERDHLRNKVQFHHDQMAPKYDALVGENDRLKADLAAERAEVERLKRSISQALFELSPDRDTHSQAKCRAARDILQIALRRLSAAQAQENSR